MDHNKYNTISNISWDGNTMKELVVQENEAGELYVLLDPELLAQLGWDEHTVLEWTVNPDSSVTVSAVRYDIDAQL